MKVLASVYACSPYDGSERAVGWNWIYELDKYHQITALTSSVYKNDIEDYISKNPGELCNTRFIYIEVPRTGWHKGYRFERIYYMLWQKEAIKIASELNRTERFDIVHHMTYVTCVLPTHMHELGIPFLLGPVAGGDRIPSIMHYPMQLKARIFERIRLLSQRVFTSTFNFHRTVKGASLILAATEDTARLIPKECRNKVRIFQAVGLKEDIFMPEPIRYKHDVPQFLMAGRMLYLKGYELGISAFVKAVESGLNAHLTILGDTEDNVSMEKYKEKIMSICGNHLGKEISVVPKVEYSKMKQYYDQFDVLINCSLRDSGCFVVMEAMARGLAVISLDTGGPKVNTTVETAIKVSPAPFEIMVDEFTKRIIELGNNPLCVNKMGTEARKYAIEHFSIGERTKKMNEFYLMVTNKKGD